jgi:hypothetical protein
MTARLGLDRSRFELFADSVHGIDFKDVQSRRPETAGMNTLFAAIAAAHPGDEGRIDAGGRIRDAWWALVRPHGAARTGARSAPAQPEREPAPNAGGVMEVDDA